MLSLLLDYYEMQASGKPPAMPGRRPREVEAAEFEAWIPTYLTSSNPRFLTAPKTLYIFCNRSMDQTTLEWDFDCTDDYDYAPHNLERLTHLAIKQQALTPILECAAGSRSISEVTLFLLPHLHSAERDDASCFAPLHRSIGTHAFGLLRGAAQSHPPVAPSLTSSRHLSAHGEPASLPAPFRIVGDVLHNVLRRRVRAVHATERQHLTRWFNHPESQIDYERYTEAFAVAYLLPNYWKAAYALHRAAPRNRSSIVDLGCGSGAASWAAIAWLASQADPAKSPELRLIDRSPSSLSLARELGQQVLASLPGFSAKIEIQQADLREPLELPDDSLVMLSHVLTENRSHLDGLLTSVASVRSSGETLIVERQDDDVWTNIDDVAAHLEWSRAGERVDVARHVENLVPALSSKATGLQTRWLLLSAPEHPAVASAVARYFDAWRRQDVELLRTVFAEGAEYMYDPFAAPLVGHEEIARYWREEVVPQQRPSIVLHTVTITAGEALIEWTASFARESLDVTVRGMMIVRVDPDQERIVELREYYRSAKMPAKLLAR